MSLRPGFWRDTPLAEMSREEWEALCDRCGKCCLVKIEDADTAELTWTSVACRLLDGATCRCMDYPNRKMLVRDCVTLTPDNIARTASWMPQSCAYRLLHEGYDLPLWHPLVTGDPDSTDKAGASMRHRTIPEYEVDEEDWEDHAIEGGF